MPQYLNLAHHLARHNLPTAFRLMCCNFRPTHFQAASWMDTALGEFFPLFFHHQQLCCHAWSPNMANLLLPHFPTLLKSEWKLQNPLWIIGFQSNPDIALLSVLDDTTVVGWISNNDTTVYRKDMEILVSRPLTHCQQKKRSYYLL